MKKNLVFLILCGSLILMWACQEDEIMKRDENEASLNFAKKSYFSIYSDDSIRFEALYNSSVDTAQIKIPVCLAGKIADREREYAVAVNEQESYGLTEGKHYILERKQVMGAGAYLDTVVLKIDVRQLMTGKIEGRLLIELVPNENFSRGMDDFQYMAVIISGAGLTAMPNFWTFNNLTDYGGEYMPVKAEKFIQLNAIPASTWKNPNKAILYAYAKKTYEWFENNPTYVDGVRVEFKGIIEY